MSAFENIAVPFKQWDNHQVIFDVQLAEHPWLADFIGRFPKCFERIDAQCLWKYYPDGDAP